MNKELFSSRHIGPRNNDISEMTKAIGVADVDTLIDETVPASIRLEKPLNLPAAMSEYEYLKHIREIAAKNKVFKSYIGMGYYNTIIPSVVKRNVLENPGWYTAYTPYQAEIAQGRLEALLNFQTMVCDLTGMELANASLLDEATAAAEAMTMIHALRSRDAKARNANVFFVSNKCFPQTIDLLKTRSKPLDIELIVGDYNEFHFSDKVFGAMLQYPDSDGNVVDYKAFVDKAHENGSLVSVATDLMSLVELTPPGEWGADVVVGNSQRFGVPLGYGGPHAAFFATREDYKRSIPGRIIGVSIDSNGNRALRMALQTREQHIKRDKATSNICTAQALLATMASMYAVYHGAEGLKRIASKIHFTTVLLADELKKLGYQNQNGVYFDTLKIQVPAEVTVTEIKELAEKSGVNFRYFEDGDIGISIDETTSLNDVAHLLSIFSIALKGPEVTVNTATLESITSPIGGFARTTDFMTEGVFNTYHSETEMMRYIKRLENKDLSLTHSMISLGSCTMKLNAASELYPITMAEFAEMHPFVPLYQAKGYSMVIDELEQALCEITGFAAVSFQPNSGAQGEYAGLMVIDKFHQSRGEGHRNVSLIPQSAHGTNPASAVMAGMQVVVVKCDENGNIDIDDMRAKAEQHKDNLSCLMVTYPSTHGVFEEGIKEITKIIHDNGGQVYMDGANMNAQVGLTNPASIGADVCHLNLHKTFAIPHGGGGPGVGPIGVAAHLEPFLPSHAVVKTGGSQGISAVSAAPWGSALILLISYAYVKMLGREGVTDSTKMAMLNANYMKTRLEEGFPVLYKGTKGHVAHEMILDCRQFKKDGVEVEDIAKRLMDYGFHAPTVSFPVPGTLMIEPTESESKEELDKFCDALLSIRKEIEEVVTGKADKTNNVLKNAPHTSKSVIAGEWDKPYSREKAVYALPYLYESKFWPPVGRVDNAYGDRNLVCTCAPIEEYLENEVVAG